MRNYKNIKAYQLADQLTIQIYELTKQFPKEEMYGLTSQLRRAVVSIATNIAEGSSRQHKKDYLQFLYIARGSLAEVEYLSGMVCRLGFIKEITFQMIDPLCQEVAKTLFGLIQSVEKEVF